MSSLSDPRKHDDLLNWQLKRLFKVGGAPAVRLCEGRYGVSRQAWHLIAVLVEDGPMSPSEACRRCLPSETGGTSRNISSLETKGLIRRLPLPGDRRRATIEATEAGHRLYSSLFPELAAINRRIMSALDEQESLLLEDFLKRLTERAEQIQTAGDGVDVRTDRRLGGSRRFWN